MKIKKLEKTANFEKETVELCITISIPFEELDLSYEGFDKLPDRAIPDILVAAGRMYKIKGGKLERVSTIARTLIR